MLQKVVSECMAAVLFMACYLIWNDDLIFFQTVSFCNSISTDVLAVFTKLIICFFSALYFLLIADSLKDQNLITFEYLVILLFAVLGLMLMCSSNDLLITYLVIELSSLAFYVLASFKKTSSYSIESGIKYFITGAVSSAFFLLGSSFLYGITGSINFMDFGYFFAKCYTCDKDLVEAFVAVNPFTIQASLFTLSAERGIFYGMPHPIDLYTYDSSLIELGFTFILCSLFIKLALAPFHLWSLDVYEGSPTSSTIFFAVLSKLSVFVIIIRLYL
jgi:NADH-quinone oxidoreductase subunit N